LTRLDEITERLQAITTALGDTQTGDEQAAELTREAAELTAEAVEEVDRRLGDEAGEEAR
jgi:hypothetical protein